MRETLRIFRAKGKIHALIRLMKEAVRAKTAAGYKSRPREKYAVVCGPLRRGRAPFSADYITNSAKGSGCCAISSFISI